MSAKTDWNNLTNYIDTVGTTLKTFTFNKTQNFVRVTTKGNANVNYTIGSQSGTLTPGQSVSVSEKITSFNLTAVSGVQTIEVWAIEDGTEKIEDNGNSLDDVVASLADKTNQLLGALNIQQYSSYKNGNDWIPAFTKAFSDLTTLGGGILNIPAGTFYINSTLVIPSNVQVVGRGIGTTVIRLSPGIDANIVSLDVHINCGISNLTIYGNRWDANPPATIRDGLVLGYAGLTGGAGTGAMPDLCIHDIEINAVNGNGFHCYPATWVYFLSRVSISYCTNYGAFIESTDNMYDTFSITSCDRIGLYITGSNNKFLNMKIITNGKTNVGTDIDRAGVFCSGKRNTFSTIECQENYGHGFVFSSAVDTDLNGLLADANGYAMIVNSSGTPTASGFYFTNCQRFSGTIKATNFKSTLSQFNGHYIDAGCISISFDYENDNATSIANDVNNSITSINLTAQKKYSIYKATWDVWTPTLTWTTATPNGLTIKARRKIIGKTVFFALTITATDGNGATGLNIALPSDMLPKNNFISIPFYNTVSVGGSTTVKQVNLRDDGTHNDINFGYMGTATATQGMGIYLSGTYELA